MWSVSNNRKGHNSLETREGIHFEMANFVNRIANTLRYLKNSNSMRSLELMPFDEYKIEECIGMIEASLRFVLISLNNLKEES